MLPSLVNLLVDPVTGKPMQAVNDDATQDRIVTGSLQTGDGATYPIVRGIPRFALTDDEGQKQTCESFGYKWKQQDSYASESFRRLNQDWQVQRYGFDSITDVCEYFGQHPLILDAGCGGGYGSSLWMTQDWQAKTGAQWIGADISQAIDVAQQRLNAYPGTHFVQADIFYQPFREATFDAIFSEGVMHHTPSTREALHRLNRLLKPGGHFLFYVYAKKAAIREFTDDHVRNLIADLPPEQAWEALRPLTKLGEALAKLKVDIDVPEDIPLLGIKAGKLDIQRFVYWNIAKLYWRDDIPFEENHHVNFDWYHPRYAHRHTVEEVRQWCEEEHLKIDHLNVQESGITVRATKAA